jgi:putative transposase
MIFNAGHIYHIYNRGNKSQRIFFSKENYSFFLRKVKQHIAPYADVLAWCLMPNHFHVMIWVHGRSLQSDHPLAGKTLNASIGIMLRSYTRAIHRQERISGSLFQQSTKAICLSDHSEISPAWFQTAFGSMINLPDDESQYPVKCFHYIHQNPVKAGLVAHARDWEFSSFQDHAGLRKGSLIHRERVEELGLVAPRPGEHPRPGDFPSPGR